MKSLKIMTFQGIFILLYIANTNVSANSDTNTIRYEGIIEFFDPMEKSHTISCRKLQLEPLKGNPCQIIVENNKKAYLLDFKHIKRITYHKPIKNIDVISWPEKFANDKDIPRINVSFELWNGAKGNYLQKATHSILFSDQDNCEHNIKVCRIKSIEFSTTKKKIPYNDSAFCGLVEYYNKQENVLRVKFIRTVVGNRSGEENSFPFISTLTGNEGKIHLENISSIEMLDRVFQKDLESWPDKFVSGSIPKTKVNIVLRNGNSFLCNTYATYWAYFYNADYIEKGLHMCRIKKILLDTTGPIDRNISYRDNELFNEYLNLGRSLVDDAVKVYRNHGKQAFYTHRIYLTRLNLNAIDAYRRALSIKPSDSQVQIYLHRAKGRQSSLLFELGHLAYEKAKNEQKAGNFSKKYKNYLKEALSYFERIDEYVPLWEAINLKNEIKGILVSFPGENDLFQSKSDNLSIPELLDILKVGMKDLIYNYGLAIIAACPARGRSSIPDTKVPNNTSLIDFKDYIDRVHEKTVSDMKITEESVRFLEGLEFKSTNVTSTIDTAIQNICPKTLNLAYKSISFNLEAIKRDISTSLWKKRVPLDITASIDSSINYLKMTNNKIKPSIFTSYWFIITIIATTIILLIVIIFLIILKKGNITIQKKAK